MLQCCSRTKFKITHGHGQSRGPELPTIKMGNFRSHPGTYKKTPPMLQSAVFSIAGVRFERTSSGLLVRRITVHVWCSYGLVWSRAGVVPQMWSGMA